MKSIIAFAGSNSKTSINKQLAAYASSKVNHVNVNLLDLNDFEVPLYGIDYEQVHGIPDKVKAFFEYIKSSDGIVLSLAEHNGAYASVFKNLFDWVSRIDTKFWSDKPMLIMATSPGGRGGATVLDIAKKSFKHMGANIVAEFSLPSFGANFSDGKVSDTAFNDELLKQVALFENAL